VDLSNEADQTLVIIGNGMVSYRLCQRMVEYNAVDDKRIVVFGDEPRPAYDRVHLTDLLSGTSSTNLLLASTDWYAHNGIELFLDDPVVEVDRENGVVRSQSGRSIAYTRLVFATGAKPFVPQVEVVSPNGEALPGVFVYRTVDDVYDIEDRADELLGSPFQEAAVIGGGILGLEAAKAVYDLGLDVHIIEVAPGLMPRQLDADGAAVLREKVEKLGVNVHCGRTLKEVEALPFEMPGAGKLTGLRLTFDKGDPMMVGMLVFAAGVRPRGELAEAAGLSTAENGGIVVDDRLQVIDKTTGLPDENIHAIGDCVAHRGSAYGLVLPGYQMVDVLASNLVGSQQTFESPDVSVRLKLMGVTVAALGEYDGDKRVGTNAHVFNGGGLYRKLVVRNGRLIGAVTIGDWENLERIRELLKSPLPLSFWDMRRFRGTGDLWAKSESPPVAEWAPEAVVCGCLRVTRGAIGQAISDGCATVDDVCGQTKAGTLCGSCKPLISELLGLEGPNSLPSNEAPTSQLDAAPISRREGIRSRREVSRSRMDLMAIPRDPSAFGSQRPGPATGRFEGLRGTLLSGASGTGAPPPLTEVDDEPAPASVRNRLVRQTEPPKFEVDLGAPRTETTTATSLAAVLRASSPAPEVKPSPRSLAVLAALHGDYGGDEFSPRKDDTKLRKEKEEASKRKEDLRSQQAPATPRTGTAVPPRDNRADEAANSTRQLEAALPLIVSGAMPLAPDAAISSLTPAAGMVLGPALRAYAASAARVAEMDSLSTKPARTHAPTPPTGIDLGSQLFGNKAVDRVAAPTPPTGIPIVAQKKRSDVPPASSAPPTPQTGTAIPEAQVAALRPSTRPQADSNLREGLSGTPTSSVTVVESTSQPPRSRRGSPSVRVVAAEPLSSRTPASGMVLDKAQLRGDAYSQLSIPRSARTGFEPGVDSAAKRTPERLDQRPVPGLSDTSAPPPSVRSRSAQARASLGITAKRTSDPGGASAASSDRAPTSVRRPNLSISEDSSPGVSDFPAEQSRSRSRISLIGAVEDREIVEVLGRESLIPAADRAPVSRRTWVPPKNLSNAPGTLTTSSAPPPKASLPSALPPERGRKALLVASIVAVSWALVLVFAPPIPPARSVRASAVVEALTINGVWKQVSGYLLVAVCVLSLGISLRKRWKRFQFSDVPIFRAIHGVVTAASLVLFFAHTGFHVGQGLNFILTVAFLAAIVIGAVAGAVFALSDRWSALVSRDRRLTASWVHILVLWPLPILIALHVVMVYYY